MITFMLSRICCIMVSEPRSKAYETGAAPAGAARIDNHPKHIAWAPIPQVRAKNAHLGLTGCGSRCNVIEYRPETREGLDATR
jgi:hypothetical protein